MPHALGVNSNKRHTAAAMVAARKDVARGPSGDCANHACKHENDLNRAWLEPAATAPLSESLPPVRLSGTYRGTIGELSGTIGDYRGTIEELSGTIGDYRGNYRGLSGTIGDYLFAKLQDSKSKDKEREREREGGREELSKRRANRRKIG